VNEITLELDMLGADEGPWELEGLQDLGAVMLEIVDPHGPAGDSTIVRVSGSRPALMVWLLSEYLAPGDDSVEEAVDLLQLQGHVGTHAPGARVTG